MTAPVMAYDWIARPPVPRGYAKYRGLLLVKKSVLKAEPDTVERLYQRVARATNRAVARLAKDKRR